MQENTPRRMRRFHRKTEQKPLLDELKSLSRPEKKFLPELKARKETPDDIAESLFEQIKEKEEKEKRKSVEKKKKAPEGKKESASTQGRQEEEIPLWKKKRMERLGQGKKNPEKKEETKKIPAGNEAVKEEKKQAPRMHRRNKGLPGEKETKKVIEELPAFKGKDISSLFGEEKKEKARTKKEETLKLDSGEEEEEDGIEELDEEGEEELFDLDEDEEDEEPEESEEETEGIDETIGAGKKNICINCKKEFSELIFCAKCGNAFCDKCAKTKQKQGNKTKYVCPHCGFVTKK